MYLLEEPSKLQDTSWIKPGKVAWDWWNANNVYGVDFKSGVNTATYKYYIDFAADNGLDYIMLDEGWYKLGNVLEVVPDDQHAGAHRLRESEERRGHPVGRLEDARPAAHAGARPIRRSGASRASRSTSCSATTRR